jgi:hypothetical protein
MPLVKVILERADVCDFKREVIVVLRVDGVVDEVQTMNGRKIVRALGDSAGFCTELGSSI